MAEKGFGVKEINLIGASGTPTIESPNNLNLNAVNVAISTNVSIGGTLTVTGNVSVGGTLTYEDVTNIDSVGIITARNGIDCNGDLDVDGHTNLDNVSIVGVVTVSSNVNTSRIIAENSSSSIPTAKFTNSGTGNQLELYGSDTSTILIKATNNDGTPKLQLRDNYNRDNFISVTDSGDNLELAVDEGNAGADSTMRFRVDGSEKLRINSTGQIITNGGSANPYPTRAATFQPASGQTNSYISIVAGNSSSVSGITFGDDADNQPGNYAGMFEYRHNIDVLAYMQNGSDKILIDRSGNVNVTGIVTATTFSGSGANLTGIAVTEAPVVDYTITGDGSHYYFHGGGVDETAGDPDLYLIRGQKYRFNNTTGSGHPFRFTSTGNANAAYSNGVTGSENGIQFWTIPYDAPAKLFYVCTIHGGMVGNIYIRGANGQNDNVGITTISGTTLTSAGHLLNLRAATGDNFIKFDNTSDSSEWSVGYDSTTRSKFDLWYDSNGSNYDLKFSVDGATGAVRKPKNPVFIAYRVNSYNLATTHAVLVYDSVQVDVGSNYSTSNGRFTAPVTGLYEFAYAAIGSNANTVFRYDLRVNGSKPYNPLTLELRIDQNQSGEYGTNGEYVCYVQMTAGQYAQVYAKSDTNVNNVYGSSNYGYTYFRGRLIG